MLWFKYKYILTVGVAFIGVKPDNNDIVSANALSNYSYVNARDSISKGIQIARCVTGMGPSGTDDNTALGRCYFNGTRKPFLKCQDSSAIIQPNVAGKLTGVINILQCRVLTTDVEGIYTCILLNSLMINESIRFGVYFTGRSELLCTFIIHNYHIFDWVSYITLYSCSSDRYFITIYCNSYSWFSSYIVLYLKRVLPQTHSHGGRIMIQQYYSLLVSLQWIILILMQCSVLTTLLIMLLQVIVEHTHVL